MEYLNNEQIKEIKSSAKFNFDDRNSYPIYYYHLYKGDIWGECMLTGVDKTRSMKSNDVLIINEKAYKIKDSSYRDHAGIFPNPEYKKGTFFQANLSFFANLSSR